MILHVLSRYPDIIEAKIFGSRAKGTHRPNSDIDLALWGNIPFSALAAARDLDELPLPYGYEVVVFDSITLKNLREHIERVGQTFYLSSQKYVAMEANGNPGVAADDFPKRG
jgi:predicted nucleotidyltransferase